MSRNTLVIVPTYNERENLPSLAARLLALPVSVDLLVVDDRSPDGTGKLADELAAGIARYRCCTARKRTVWAARIAPVSPGLWNAITSSFSRWTAIFRTTRTTSLCFWRPPGPRTLSSARGTA